MKKILFLLLLTATIYGQNPTPFTKIKVTGNTTSATASKVNVQEANGEINTISKTDLQDILTYSTASALPVTGVVGKLYYTIDNFTYYKWNGTIYDEFGTGGSGSGTVTSVAALTLGTTGTDLSSSVTNSTTTPVITLNVPTASASNRGALSSTDWSTFNGKQDALGFTPYNATNPAGYISSYTETDPLALKTANNLSDLASVSTARTNLGLGSLATQSGTFSDKVDKITPITGATKTKITYNTQGQITSGADATTADIADSTDKRYQTDNQQSFNDATSSIQTQLNGKQPSGSYLTSYTETDPIVKAINGIIKSNGTTISAAIADTDYLTPTGSAAGLTSFPTLNQNTTGTAGGLSADIPQTRVTNLTTDLAAKQATLVSGTNIKTINSTSLLGSGDITAGDMTLASTQTNSGLKTFLDGTFGFRNVANTFTSLFTNTNTAARTYTFQNKTGTIAQTDDYSLVPLDEGNGIGHVINGRTAANYGNIGFRAIDFSTSNSTSSTKGATGQDSFVGAGTNLTASGTTSVVTGGNLNNAGGLSNVIGGGGANTTSSNYTTIAGGVSNTVSGAGGNVGGGDTNNVTGQYGTISGGTNMFAKSYGEWVGGLFGTSYTIGGSGGSTFNSTDRIFSVGNGTASGSRSDAIIILKNGLATLPSVTNSLIATESTGKAVVTREYLESKAQTGQIIVTSGTSFTTPSTITTATVFNIELVGAGGGGAGSVNAVNGQGSGGGAGGYVFKRLTGLSPSTTYTCAIGSGGSGGAFTVSGTAGTDTTLTIGGITYTASGGGAGLAAQGSEGGAGGTGTNGDINIIGQMGGDSPTTSFGAPSGSGGSSPKGWGLGGASVKNQISGRNGTGYGAGGSAGHSNTGSPIGGNGSQGLIFCQWFN